ncbi:hypothetical protein ANCCAN_29732 [Ancylostoma caninum]|uniref:Uncharacterized protein n=1 Tax=Ancylostoma caninum TaxID=29170 RepID=A0A368F0P8_ANCCA|nr:hypothetical protein ANCCAN_29732 [Ancylostoma caninum]
MFDTSLGFVHLLRSLLSHSHITIPEFAAPYLQYLTKSIVSQMASRSYKDIGQFVSSLSHGSFINLFCKVVRALCAFLLGQEKNCNYFKLVFFLLFLLYILSL